MEFKGTITQIFAYALSIKSLAILSRVRVMWYHACRSSAPWSQSLLDVSDIQTDRLEGFLRFAGEVFNKDQHVLLGHKTLKIMEHLNAKFWYKCSWEVWPLPLARKYLAIGIHLIEKRLFFIPEDVGLV